jgi:hypothetical protein
MMVASSCACVAQNWELSRFHQQTNCLTAIQTVQFIARLLMVLAAVLLGTCSLLVFRPCEPNSAAF